MKLVKATAESKNRKIRIKELHRIAEPGEQFTVSDDRFNVLNGANYLKVKFVELVDVITPEVTVNKPIEVPQATEEPEIYVINPGEAPVKVDEDLKPIEDAAVVEENKEELEEPKPVKTRKKKTIKKESDSTSKKKSAKKKVKLNTEE